MDDVNIIKDSKDICQILEMREKDEITAKVFASEEIFSSSELYNDKKINILMIINIIPNSFVLSYLAALQCVLSKYFEHQTLDKSATINVLFMGEAVISKDGAWECDFINHYEKIMPECKRDRKDGENVRKTLMELKRSEFESFLNMILYSFDDPCIKKAIKNGKIELNFNNLSKERRKLVDMHENGEEFDVDKLTEFRKNVFSNSITDVQKKMFFNGENHAVIIEMGRLLDYWLKNTSKGNFIFITAEVFRESIKGCYKDGLWKRIKSNIICFNDPPIRNGKMLMYLNPLSTYVNEANKIRYIELEEFYHYDVLRNLKSSLFKHHLDEMQNMFRIGEDEYNKNIKNKLAAGLKTLRIEIDNSKKEHNTYQLIDRLQSEGHIQFNLLHLRLHQMEVMNNGFLRVNDEIIKQLALVL